EPPDHALGRSRGGLTTKVHGAADGRCRTLAVHVTAGQVHDTTQFAAVLAGIRVPRAGAGRPRTRPDRVVADKAYSSRANRALLRRRGIAHTIPERGDQQAHRARRGRRGGRPCGFNGDAYRRRNTVERDWNKLKQWRGIATRYDKTATNYRGGILLAVLLTWTPK
ncbi:MAG TPA: IS5 family transposase, partial [Euzebyales bacterium]|nr:IS5 family transposase [Euzebyales bacterium]